MDLGSFYIVEPQYRGMIHEIGLADVQAVYTHPAIQVWRSIPERENAVLDADLADGRSVRLHIKRFVRAAGKTPAEAEVEGISLLRRRNIPTVPLVGYAVLPDRRSFIITEDLAGYAPADKAVAAGTPFASLLRPLADLAARLHNARLHHRDLYLCHLFVRTDAGIVDVRLIDAGRVDTLGGLFSGRWIVKDLAQFWYSTLPLPITDKDRDTWLRCYAERRQIRDVDGLRRRIEGKVKRIAAHDARLRQQQPGRNISIPQA